MRSIAGRFEITLQLAVDGPRELCRGVELAGGSEVALKLHRGAPVALARFVIEQAGLLGALGVPGLVEIVAAGVEEDCTLYLATRWMQGESLARRMEQRQPELDELLLVTRALAQMLAALHARRRVVGPDLRADKVLVGPRLEVTLLDFGLWRAEATDVGDPGVDVRSLGRLLGRCLGGVAPVPPALSALQARLAAGDLADGAAVVAALQELASEQTHQVDLSDLARTVRPALLTRKEVRLLSVVLAGSAPPPRQEPTLPGRRRASSRSGRSLAGLASLFESREALARLVDTVEGHGGSLEAAAEGSLVVTLAGGSGTEQATRAGHCALAIRRALPAVPVAVATGRGEIIERRPDGEVMDRALRLLRAARPAALSDEPPRIRIDEVTAGLLDRRLEVQQEGGAHFLGGERPGPGRRTLLGQDTPCVGRTAELAELAALVQSSITGHAARAAVICGLAGIGKSRLRQELVAQLLAAPGEPEVWLARADPLGAGSPFSLLAQLVRRAVKISEGQPLPARRERLERRVGQHFPPDEARRVSQFLGELAGVPHEEAGSVELAAARSDPALMGDQMRRAWEDFLSVRCRVRPVVLVLEDLHWGDLPSVQFIDAALRYLHDAPLCVLAFARPEVDELFPQLWAEHGVHRMTLSGLDSASCRQLVQSVLGAEVGEARLKRLIERAGGNAFFLEELIRAVAEGKGEGLPGTVMAMVQARLETLDEELRRVVRAGSTFGEILWLGGVQSLLPDIPSGEVAARLERLVALELITARDEPRFEGEQEYGFRHALVREAAYGMLTESDRRLAHRQAALWLEAAGESEALVLAEHWQRGAELRRAGKAYLRAAEQALEGNDLRAALARVDRGLRCGAEGELLGLLRLREAEAHNWRGELELAARRGLEAMTHLSPGSAGWSQAAGQVAVASGKLGTGDLVNIAGALLELPEGSGAPRLGVAYVTAAAATIEYLLYAGQEGTALMLLDRLERLVASRDVAGPLTLASLRRVQATRVMRSGDPGAGIELYRETTRCFERAGDLRNAATYRMGLGYALAEAGAYEEAEQELRSCLQQAVRSGLPNLVAMAQQNLGLVLHRRGLLGEARAPLEASLEALQAQGDRRMEGGSRVYLARLHMDQDQLEAAEAEAERAVAILEVAPPLQAHALATLAQIRLRRGALPGARQAAARAMALTEELTEVEEGESTIRLVHAEVLQADGDLPAAHRALRQAHARLLERAARISEPRWRTGFLQNVKENARTLELGRTWLGLSSPGPV